ncbi:MAG: hypothetical protein J6Q86_01510 [Methanobrevibacter sp.]|nr:hypothetical protein [Methanobrevibacter sp.]
MESVRININQPYPHSSSSKSTLTNLELGHIPLALFEIMLDTLDSFRPTFLASSATESATTRGSSYLSSVT